MSLVAYGSSDESENEEDSKNESQIKLEEPKENLPNDTKLSLPSTITKTVNNLNVDSDNVNSLNDHELNFDTIPKPKPIEVDKNDIVEIDNVPVPKKVNYAYLEKPPKKEKGRTKISIPSLADFQDLEEQSEPINTKKKPSKKGSGLIAILPPPKGSIITTKSNSLIPHVLTTKPTETKKPVEIKSAVTQSIKKIQKPSIQKKSVTSTLKSLSNYHQSDSEEEDEKYTASGTDFFSLSTPAKIPDEGLPSSSSIDTKSMIDFVSPSVSSNDTLEEDISLKEENELIPVNTLVSNVMNLPKEEILLKNKAEVGPKLPVPEQEYNIDSEGNVAFDEKAIEYLCGRRGVKRKNEFSNVDIVEINGEDIKPDKREWLIKALTEEPVQRPISAGAGPSGQSKKKHQITYLAHQAKAMELELKNQWAQNKASRQQTRSKYGF